MKLAILKETHSGETRVAMIPPTLRRLVQSGMEAVVESGAGKAASWSDKDYEGAGAQVARDADGLKDADVFLGITPPADGESLPPAGKVLVSMLRPLVDHDLVRRLAEAGVTGLALDMIPRITRAQSMDVLSSMSTLAGYKAVLLAAGAMHKIIPMMMTAAGTIRPAGALVIGAGVAGLQAIATAKRLGAVVTAVDVRPDVKEQIESLGAKFVPMEVDHSAEDAGGYAADMGEEFYAKEQEILAPHVKNVDMVITTALVPGRAAPVLITEQMVSGMRAGAVIVDLAATAGGNCTLTRPDETVVHEGVTILGPTNLPALVPIHASEMFSRNVEAFLKEIVGDDGALALDADNEIIKGALITRDGQIVHEAVLEAIRQVER